MNNKDSVDADALLRRVGLRHRIGDLTYAAESFDFLNPSFSLAGEDLILRKILKDKLVSRLPGVYVDVGALHPFFGSNTYLFYMYGWSGICIDANRSYAETFAKVRPNDTFVHSAVCDSERELYFARHLSNTGMSQVFASADDIEGDFGEPVKVPGRPLSAILDEYLTSGGELDLMSVDVEDMDLEVLRSNQWDKYRPRVLCAEDRGIAAKDPASSSLVRFMSAQGYAVSAIAPPNVFFQDQAYHPIV